MLTDKKKKEQTFKFVGKIILMANNFNIGLILKPMQISLKEILKNSNGTTKRCKKNKIISF